MPGLSTRDIARMPRDEAEMAIRARVRSVPVSDGLTLVRVLGHYKMLLSQADRGFGCHVMLDGYWEIWLTQFLAQRTRPGMRAVDIGANFGYYTLLLGGAVGHHGQVLSVEPGPETAAVLRENVLLNGLNRHVEVHEVALGALPDQTVTLFTPKGEPKNALVVTQTYDHGTSTTVKSTTLGALAAGRPIDLVKVDAEGAEADILVGMIDILRRDKPLLVLEFNAARYPDPRAVLADTLAVYGRMGSLGLDSVVRPVDLETVVTTEFGEDWLLVFASN